MDALLSKVGLRDGKKSQSMQNVAAESSSPQVNRQTSTSMMNLPATFPMSPDSEVAVDFARKGGPLLKVRSKLSKNTRHFYMDEDGLVLRYTGSKKIKRIRKLLRQNTEDMSMVLISDIKEIREGALSDRFDAIYKRDQLPPAERCFVLLIGERYETLDLVARTAEERTMWVKALNHHKERLLHHVDVNPRAVRNAYLRIQFERADKNKNGTLELKEIIRLLNDANASVTDDYAKLLCLQAKMKTKALSNGLNMNDLSFKQLDLNIDEFITFVDDLMRRKDVDDIFKSYDKNTKGYVTAEELLQFFKDNHDNHMTINDCNEVIQKCEVVPELKEKHFLSKEGFDTMFNTKYLDVLKGECKEVYQDMTQPLCNYFIDSSHNTYLQANQLTGDSRVESYVIALREGCRCVELDVWDGDKEPEIFHGLGGFTMTSKILFRDVIEVVEKFAFETSDYPVILSLENHCSVEQQTMMARIMRSMLGDKLLSEPLSEDCTQLPSPEQLKGKVIVKCKKISDPGELNFDMEELCGNLEDDNEDGTNKEQKAKALEEYKQKMSEKSHELSQELSDCIVICRATSFKGFEEAAKGSFAEMSSFSESKALKLIEKDWKGYVKHNQWQLSRIYPAGSRTDSSNYNPIPMWLAGCQIVALNIQTPDQPMHVNKGLFEDNGRCGFVLKPEFLRSANPRCHPGGPYPKDWQKTLKIKVIAGYQLPKKEGDDVKSIVDPYVKVSILGVEADQRQYQTKVVEDNGLNPEWHEEFVFSITCSPFAFVYFQIYDSSTTKTDPNVAQYCLPFSCVRQGYKMINLKSPKGETDGSSQLLVHITIT